jgi:5-bromo-4-chloroindolyl phosphate hydrolysis protein
MEHSLIIIILICVICLFFIIVNMLLKHSVIIDNFDNTDLYTKQSCCNEKQIKFCEKWGKTGVCNFQSSDKSCMCLDAF